MAVQARHRNLFRPTNLDNRQMMMLMNGVEGNGSTFGAQVAYGVVAPLSGVTTATADAVRSYAPTSTLNTNISKPAAMKSDNLCPEYALPVVSRKRSRETIDPLLSAAFPCVALNNQSGHFNRGGPFTFLGEDISSQIQQQQMDIDRFISQHTEKLRLEMEERRIKYSRRIAAAMEDKILKKLEVKEAEIERIGKLNTALEERVKSLSVENQIWRDVAQTNEAKANSLRCELEQALAQVQQDQNNHQHRTAEDAALQDDAQSCCGSNLEEMETPATVESSIRQQSERACRRCGKEESSVLLLPCRHLCLCTACGSSLHTCPVCNSVKTASLHLNLSSSFF